MTQIIQPALLFPMYAGLIPAMTGYTTPSGTASAIGGIESVGHLSWQAMSRVPSDYFDPGTSATGLGVIYQLPTPRKIRYFNVAFKNITTELYDFGGSNDGSTYTILLSTSNANGTFFTVNPTIAYAYYRVVCQTVGSAHQIFNFQVYS